MNHLNVMINYFLEVSKCVPVKKLIFLKTHKTGSCTLQNIILRYGMQNNLTFVLQNITTTPYKKEKDYKHLYPEDHVPHHVFNEFRQFQSSWSEHYNEGLTNDVFAIHGVWDNLEIRKLIPNGPAVTILRDPIDVFESSYSFYGNSPKVILSSKACPYGNFGS